ncbi:MAG: ABC transporter permease [Pyrinomonadaceae bacterium]|nr:ABC transporter permease [Pyrinomonadaceae bacterium]
MLVSEKLEYGPDEGPALPSSSSHSTHALPRVPVIRIRPARAWALLDVGELQEYHELFYFLVWRDLKARYKQAALGAAWVVLQPVLMALIFTVFLGMLVGVPSSGLPYSIFVYAGLLPWAFFNNAVLSSSQSLVGGAHLITKVYFPRLFLPAASVAVRLADFCVAAVILFALLFYYGFEPSWKLLLFPALVAELTLLAVACGLWSAALNVRYRDVGTLLPVLLQLWMFTSPIVYSSSVVPEKWRSVYSLNPLVGIIEGMRACLFNLKLDWPSIAFSVIVTGALLVYSTYAFHSAEESFADVV